MTRAVWLTPILLSAAVIFTLAPSQADQSAAAGYAKLKPSLARVWAFDAKGVPVNTGSGFVVASDASGSSILTAAHVVAHCSSIKLDFNRDLHDVRATVIATGSGDLALLRIARGGLRAATLTTRRFAEGDTIAIAGYVGSSAEDALLGGLGQEPRLLYPGTISSFPNNAQLIEISNVELEHGMSGAPLFDPASGAVLGMIDSKLPNQRTGIAIGVQSVVTGFLGAQHVNYVAMSAPPAKPKPAKPKSNPLPAVKPQTLVVAAVQSGPVVIAPPSAEPVPADPRAAMQALFFNRNETEAARAARAFLDAHPGDDVATTVLAATLRASDPLEAVRGFDGLETVPRPFLPYAADAYYHAAQMQVKSGDKTLAIANLERGQDLFPTEESRLLLDSLSAPSASRDEPVAAPACGGAAQSGVVSSCINAARSMESSGNWRGGVDLLRRAAFGFEETAPKRAIRLDVEAGDMLLRDGNQPADSDAAMTICDRVLRIDASSGLANLYAALVERYDQHNMEAARERLVAARSNPSDIDPLWRVTLRRELRFFGMAE